MKEGLTISFLILIYLNSNGSSYANYQSEQKIKERLMEYAEEKYGGDFTEMSYRRAVDKTRSYDLCLKDSQGRIFNVSEDASSGFHYDDYLECIVDHKMHDYLLEHLDGMSNDFNISIMSSMNVFTDKVTLEKMTIDECIKEFGLSSLIFVCHFDESNGNIAERGKELVDIYRKLCDIGAEVINFNVIVTSGEDSEVKNILTNMRDLYTGCWYTCKNVKEYVSDAFVSIDSVEDLLNLVKEG